MSKTLERLEHFEITPAFFLHIAEHAHNLAKKDNKKCPWPAWLDNAIIATEGYCEFATWQRKLFDYSLRSTASYDPYLDAIPHLTHKEECLFWCFMAAMAETGEFQ